MKKLPRLLTFIVAISLLLPLYPANAEVGNVDKANIERLAGKNRYETSAKIAKELDNSYDKVILASGENYPDALSGAVLTGGENPIVLTSKASLSEPAKEIIKKADEVIILGGKGAVSSQVEEEVKELSNKVTRIAGKNRYETSVKIASEVKSSEIILASGENYPDALAGGPLSIENNSPILLVQKNSLPSEIEKYIKDNNIKSVTILGGKGAVSENVENEVKEMVGSVRRLAGKNRLDTSLKIAEEFHKPRGLIYASAYNYPDALSAAPLGGKMGVPIILLGDFKDTEDYLISVAAGLEDIFIVGGKNAIGEGVETQIASLLKGESEEAGKKEIEPKENIKANPKDPTPKLDEPENKKDGPSLASEVDLKVDPSSGEMENGVLKAWDNLVEILLEDPNHNIMEVHVKATDPKNELILKKSILVSQTKQTLSIPFPEGSFGLYDIELTAVAKDGRSFTVTIPVYIPEKVQEFEFDKNTGTITKYNGTDTSVVIPKTIDGVEVKAIGPHAFEDNTGNRDPIIGVSFPDTISTIGEFAFANNKIARLVLPTSIRTIGNSAFYNNEIRVIDNSHYIKSIGQRAFMGNNLQTVTLGRYTALYPQGKEYSSFDLNVDIIILGEEKTEEPNETDTPNRIDDDPEIGHEYVFDANTGTITAFRKGDSDTVSIPSQIDGKPVVAIGDDAFKNADLDGVSFPNTIQSIGARAFQGNDFASVSLPPNASYVESYPKGITAAYNTDASFDINVTINRK